MLKNCKRSTKSMDVLASSVEKGRQFEYKFKFFIGGIII